MADGYALGVAVRRAGGRLVLARRPARLHMPGGGFAETARWVVRWTPTIRRAVPGAYAIVAPLTAAPLLLVACAALTPYRAAAFALLAAHTLARALVAALVDALFCRDQSMLRSLHLLPLLRIVEAAATVAGALGRTVNWRGRRYRCKAGVLPSWIDERRAPLRLLPPHRRARGCGPRPWGR
ncbi:MAG: hypothetical protein ACYTED_17070 [Planctomycetota bacterium]|jgi:hypothetical protein